MTVKYAELAETIFLLRLTKTRTEFSLPPESLLAAEIWRSRARVKLKTCTNDRLLTIYKYVRT